MPRVRISRVLTGVVMGISAVCLSASVVGTYTGWWRITPVKTGSMRPGIPVDSVIVAVQTNIEDVQAGDVILFKAPTAPYEMIVHRIIEIKTDKGEKVFKTKGDANNVSDPWAVKLKGAKVWTLAKVFPRLGIPLRWFADPLVRLIVVVTIGLIALMLGFVWIWTDGVGRSTPRGVPVTLIVAGVLVVSVLGVTRAFASYSSTNFTGGAVTSGSLAAPSPLTCIWSSSTNVNFTWTNTTPAITSGYDLRKSSTSGSSYAVIQSTVGAASVTGNDPATTAIRYYVAQAKKDTSWTSPDSNEMATNRCTAAIYTMAGNGTASNTGDGAAATSAAINHPMSIVVDSATSTTYVGDFGGRVRSINAAGVINLVAGNGAPTPSCTFTGTPTAAPLGAIYSIAVDSSSNLYLGDNTGCIRKISGGVMSTIVGGGASTACNFSGLGTAFKATTPYGLAVDSAGAVFFSDYTNNCVHKLSGTTVSQFAGGGASAGCGFAGVATTATLNKPFGLNFDPAGNLLIAEYAGKCVRSVTAAGAIKALAGTATGTGSACNYSGQVSGLVLSVNTTDAVMDANGNLMIADYLNHCVRRVVIATGVVTQVTGTGAASITGDNGAAIASSIRNPMHLAIATNGDLLIADYNFNRVRVVVGPL